MILTNGLNAINRLSDNLSQGIRDFAKLETRSDADVRKEISRDLGVGLADASMSVKN